VPVDMTQGYIVKGDVKIGDCSLAYCQETLGSVSSIVDHQMTQEHSWYFWT